MKQKKTLFGIRQIISFSTITLLIILLCFPSSSLVGAEKGVMLWFNVICPTLLPFVIVSRLIINLNLTSSITKLFYPLFHRIFAVSRHGCYVAIIGLLTGLPVGAKSCADLVKNGLITKKEGQYLLTFCNNASPMFIISYVGITTLHLPGSKYIFLLLIYSAAFLTSFSYRLLHRERKQPKTAVHEYKEDALLCAMELGESSSANRLSFTVVDDAIMNGFDVLTRVGGYIILFSILSNVIISIAPENNIFSYLTVGILEITNGVNAIGASTFDVNIKIALILSLTSFGGFSSIAQTKSVIDDSGLSIKNYTFYKLINAGLTFLLTFIYINIM